MSEIKIKPVLSFSSFVHNSSINKHKNMKLFENIFVMNWLIEFYITVALGIICKRIIKKFSLKSFLGKKVKYEWFFEKKKNS